MAVDTLVDNAGDLDASIARRAGVGFLLIIGLVGGIGGWAVKAPLLGAIMAPGVVVVDSNDKKVQHPTGGVVGEILVKNGTKVEAGDVVLRLDDTQARTNVGIITSQITHLIGQKARLEAERDGAGAIVFPVNFETSDAESLNVTTGERKLFEDRQLAKEGQKAQLTERIGQFRREIEGLEAQRSAKSEEVELMRKELSRVDELRERELVNVQRALTTRRDLTRLEGELGVLFAQIARTKGQIDETQLQIMSLDQTMRTEATTTLREIEERIAELAERKNAAQDQLTRIDLRAPQSGFVHELAVHTVGGVIAAGDPVMTIVPDRDTLVVEVRIAPTDIDQIFVGQKATMRFSAFNRLTTPEVDGVVSRVSADLTTDRQTGAVYYVARMTIPPEQMGKIKDLTLLPGMPAETFIVTSERTALSYLLKPLSDHYERAMREE